MARDRKPEATQEELEVSQEEATQPRPRDAQGYELDEHGLPLNGPARARRLAERNIGDPAQVLPIDTHHAPDPAPIPEQ